MGEIAPAITTTVCTMAGYGQSVKALDVYPLGINYISRKKIRRFPIAFDDFYKNVGKTGTKVWGLLIGLRNQKGIAHPTRNYIARTLQVSVATVAKALRRLKKLGLIIPLGKIVCKDANPHSKHDEVMAYAWHVEGVVSTKNSKVMYLPRLAADAIRTACSWGGRRKGAGRRKVSSVSTDTKSIRLSTHPLRGSSLMATVKDGRYISSGVDMTGLKISGKGRYVEGWWSWLEKKGVPRYPSRELIKPPIMPHPPKLDASMPDNQKAHMLAATYRMACQHYFRKKSWLGVRGDIRKSKYYDRLVAAADVFLKHGIPPAAWTGWVFRYWKDQKGSMPSISVVYNAANIEKRRGWYARECGISGGQVIITDTHRELLHRYSAMRRALRRLKKSIDIQEVQDTVDRYFPDGLYDLLLQQAQAESQTKQARLDSAVRNGRWIWK